MPRGIFDTLRATHRTPARQRIKQIPGSAKARSEVAEGIGSVQDVEREISRREPLLSQLAAKDVHGIVSDGCRFGKSSVRQEKGSSFLHVSRGSLCVGERRLAFRVFLQRDIHRLLKRKRRTFLDLLRVKLPRVRQYEECYQQRVRCRARNSSKPASKLWPSLAHFTGFLSTATHRRFSHPTVAKAGASHCVFSSMIS